MPVFFVPAAGIIMFLIPFGWLWNKRRVRLKKFAAQLPDALELVARALRAGHSPGRRHARRRRRDAGADFRGVRPRL